MPRSSKWRKQFQNWQTSYTKLL